MSVPFWGSGAGCCFLGKGRGGGRWQQTFPFSAPFSALYTILPERGHTRKGQGLTPSCQFRQTYCIMRQDVVGWRNLPRGDSPGADRGFLLSAIFKHSFENYTPGCWA